MRVNFAKWIIFILFFLSLISFIRALTLIIFSKAPDFSVLWTGAADLIRGANPYINPSLFTGIGYPPNTLLLYLPFSLLPYQFAQVLFTLLSFGSFLGIIIISFKIIKEKFSWQTFLVVFSLSLLSFPTRFTLGMGQNNLIAFFLLLLAYFFYKEGKLGRAGLILGLAISIKTIFAFFIIFFVLKKQWKVIKLAGLTIAATIGITSIFSNINLYGYYLKEVVPPLFNLSRREIYYNQGVMGFISRLTNDLYERKYISLIISLFLTVFASWLALYKKGKDLQFSLFITTLLLIDTLSWQHHFVLLIFPFILVANFVTRRKFLFYLILIVTSYLLVSWNFSDPSPYYDFPKSLILSNTFFGALMLFFINASLILNVKRTQN
ncbi:DUF2029 domain-containing protein [Candidatus Woesebacteria bacterium]|nr:DUF2029 domain-containing protein [Candidatus Woesebacteria bacterium]